MVRIGMGICIVELGIENPHWWFGLRWVRGVRIQEHNNPFHHESAEQNLALFPLKKN